MGPARALALIALLLAHAPLAYFVLLKKFPALLVAALVIVAAVVIWGPALRRRLPRIAIVWIAAYYLGVAVGQVMPTYFLQMISKPYVLAMLLLALAAGLAARFKRAGAAVGVAILLLAGHTALAMPAYKLAGVSLVACMAVVAAHVGALSTAPGRARFFAVYGLLGMLKMAAFLSSEPLWLSGPVLDQAGVRPVYLLADKSAPIYDLIGSGSEARFLTATDNGRRALIGIRGNKPGLVLVNPEDPADLKHLPFEGDSSDNAALHPARNVVYVSDYGAGYLYMLNADSLEVLDKQPSDVPMPGLWRLSTAFDRLLLLHDANPDIYSVDPRSLQTRARVSLGRNADLVLDEPHATAWHMTNNGTLTALDLDTLVPRADTKLPGFTYFNLAVDPAEPALYVSSMSTGRIAVLDPLTLEVKRSAVLHKGVRHIAVVPGGRIALTNYMTGELLFLDARSLEVTRRVRLGPRPRWLELDPYDKSLLVTSALGAFRVDAGHEK